jgi:hypothetical protein
MLKSLLSMLLKGAMQGAYKRKSYKRRYEYAYAPRSRGLKGKLAEALLKRMSR